MGPYRFLDSGEGRKLEELAGIRVDRPMAHAVWPKGLSSEVWESAWAEVERGEAKGNTWRESKLLPESWEVETGGIRFRIRPTPFGHLGIFAEQRVQWPWIRDLCAKMDEPEVLNLFAYTGGSTLASAQGGARVTHVDSAKGVVQWARENAELNGLGEHPIRWMVEDVSRYVQREVRRGRVYQGIILDPPSFGRGSKGQVFKIEDDLLELLRSLWQILDPQSGFLLLSCHSAGFTPLVLRRLLEATAPGPGTLEEGELCLESEAEPKAGVSLPTGVYARWVGPDLVP